MSNPFRQSGMIRAMSLQSATVVEDSARLATTGFYSNIIKSYLPCQAGASAILNRLCLARRSAQPRWAVASGLHSSDCPDIEAGHWQLGPFSGQCMASVMLQEAVGIILCSEAGTAGRSGLGCARRGAGLRASVAAWRSPSWRPAPSPVFGDRPLTIRLPGALAL